MKERAQISYLDPAHVVPQRYEFVNEFTPALVLFLILVSWHTTKNFTAFSPSGSDLFPCSASIA
jgi:hypothetical protein